MSKEITWSSKYFYGSKISEYGLERGYLDYRTLAKAFDAVLNNNIMQLTWDIGYWDQENGFIDNSDEIEELNDRISELMLDNENGEHDDEIEEIQGQINELENEQEYQDEIYQYYIVSDPGAKIIKEFTNDPLFYNEELDMYIWGVTHCGTSWNYVLTNVKLELDEKC